MKKVNQDPFSNGTEYMLWAEWNCDRCVKYAKTFASEHRCAIARDIDTRVFTTEPIAQRTIDICRLKDCPYRKEHWPIHKRKSKTAKLPSLFKED